jgi:hypothetical protein
MTCFHCGVRARLWVAGAGAVAVLAGTGAPAARADACPADARASYARVQLFKDGACSGASVSVGFTGSGDRPDFAAFTNYEGAVYDIDDTRDSAAVAPATCIRLFDGKRYTGADSGLLCAPPTADGLFAGLGALTNRASSMRVCPASATSGCDAVTPPPPPPPVPNGSPASRDARLAATLAGGRTRRTVGFGRAAVVRVRLTAAGGSAIAGAALQVFTREQSAGSEWRVAPGITTGPDGSARLRLAPGPSRRIRVEYRALTGDAQPAAVGRARLAVRAGVTLRIRPRLVRAGHSIRLRGRLRAAPTTALGKVVTFQARERGRWRDFKSVRSGRRGRFHGRYRFTGRASGSFPIRAVALADASYPYATGHSRAVRVRVR